MTVTIGGGGEGGGRGEIRAIEEIFLLKEKFSGQANKGFVV